MLSEHQSLERVHLSSSKRNEHTLRQYILQEKPKNSKKIKSTLEAKVLLKLSAGNDTLLKLLDDPRVHLQLLLLEGVHKIFLLLSLELL